MPTSLDLAMRWRVMRAERLAAQKRVDEMQVAEKEYYDQLVAQLRKSKNKSVSNGERLFQLVTSEEPFAEDYPKLYEHIKKTGAFELLYRRINPAAVKERWELGEKVPGVGRIPIERISDTQAK